MARDFQNTKTINVSFNVVLQTAGTKTFIFKESTTNTTYKNILKVLNNHIELYVDYPPIINDSDETDVSISVVSEKITSNYSPVIISFPDIFNVTVVSEEDNIIFDGNNYVFTPNLIEQTVDEIILRVISVSGNHTSLLFLRMLQKI